MNANNRSNLYLYAAPLALSLALVVGTPAKGLASVGRGKIIHPALGVGSAHFSANTSGLRCMWSWLRRWF